MLECYVRVSPMIQEFNRTAEVNVNVYVYVERVLNQQPTHVSCMCTLLPVIFMIWGEMNGKPMVEFRGD